MRIEFHDEREFKKWLRSVGNVEGGRVAGKIALVADLGGSLTGMPLVRSIDRSLHEIRVSKYRVYFTHRDGALLVLAAGEKDTQQRDIARARRSMP